ncbi:MAG: hypothetical protein U0Z53_29130 [Blastocatellia bacterium]
MNSAEIAQLYLRSTGRLITATSAQRRLADRIWREIRPVFQQALAAHEQMTGSPSGISESFLAGQISVENSYLDPARTRFEPGVLRHLRLVRDGRQKEYNGLHTPLLSGKTEAELTALSFSYGLFQVMGYYSLLYGFSLSSLKSPADHPIIAVRLIQQWSGRNASFDYLAAGRWDCALRIWNTGQPGGKTFDPNYVRHALTQAWLYQQRREAA